MTCTEFLEILDDVIDESIAVGTRTEIEAHLKKCGHCEVVLNTTRKTIEIFRCHEIYEVPRRSQRAPPRQDHGEVQKGEVAPVYSQISLSSLCLHNRIVILIPPRREKDLRLLFLSLLHHENGCPRSLVRRGGGTWDRTSLDRPLSIHHENGVPHPSFAWVG